MTQNSQKDDIKHVFWFTSTVGVLKQTKRNKGSWERERTAPLSIDGTMNSCSKVAKATAAECDTLERFDLVVDAFSLAVGVVTKVFSDLLQKKQARERGSFACFFAGILFGSVCFKEQEITPV